MKVVLRQDKVTGPRGMEFENQHAAWQRSKFAISTTNGIAALQMSLSALGVGPGDEVIVPSRTFSATSFAVVQAGAIPRYVRPSWPIRHRGAEGKESGG